MFSARPYWAMSGYRECGTCVYTVEPSPLQTLQTGSDRWNMTMMNHLRKDKLDRQHWITDLTATTKLWAQDYVLDHHRFYFGQVLSDQCVQCPSKPEIQKPLPERSKRSGSVHRCNCCVSRCNGANSVDCVKCFCNAIYWWYLHNLFIIYATISSSATSCSAVSTISHMNLNNIRWDVVTVIQRWQRQRFNCCVLLSDQLLISKQMNHEWH